MRKTGPTGDLTASGISWTSIVPGTMSTAMSIERAIETSKKKLNKDISSFAGKGSVLKWDGHHVTNNATADKYVTKEYRKGWDPFV